MKKKIPLLILILILFFRSSWLAEMLRLGVLPEGYIYPDFEKNHTGKPIYLRGKSFR